MAHSVEVALYVVKTYVTSVCHSLLENPQS